MLSCSLRKYLLLLQTYNLDRQVADSATSATAFLSGVKANYITLGVNGKVKVDDCKASLDPENRVHSILKWAQDAGKETGKSWSRISQDYVVTSSTSCNSGITYM